MTKYTTTSVKSSGLCLAFLLSIFTIPTFADNQTLGDDPQCDNTTLHTTNGSVTLNANWSATEYSCRSGEYLRASDASWQQCPADSFCNGSGTYTYTEGVDGCLNLCSANSRNKSDYQYSDAGTTTEDACYKTGTVSCATHTPYFAAHGTAIYTSQTATGRMYLGLNPADAWQNADESNDVKMDNVSDCNIASVQCDAGYTLSGSFGALYPYVQENTLNWKKRSRNLIDSGANYGDQTGLNNGDWIAIYNDGTQINGVATCVDTDIGAYAVNTYFNQNVGYVASGTMSTDDFIDGLLNAGAIQSQVQELLSYAQPYMAGYINDDQFGVFKDKAFRTVPGNTFTPGTTGQYCWCKLTGYKLSGDSQETVSNSRWFYEYVSNGCHSDCATECAKRFEYATRDNAITMFGDLASFPTCEPNAINLDWNLNNGSVHGQSQCTYNGGITLPDVPTRNGYTFGGWRVRQCSLSQYYQANNGTDYGYINDTAHASNPRNEKAEQYELTEDNTWAVEFAEGTLRGRAICSGKSGNNYNYTWGGASSDWTATESELVAASGEQKYCWCAGTDFDNSCHVVSPSWVFAGDYVYTYNCANLCAGNCAVSVGGSFGPDFRRAVFGVTQ